MSVLQSLRSLPREVLPPSAAVDFLHFFACGKPAVRVRMRNMNGLTEVAAWCQQYGLVLQADSEGYICIASTAELADLVLLVDRSVEPHERQLGKLLGYPVCCCNFVAALGEANIDWLAPEIANWLFVGRFRRIDPTGYLKGKSLICHLPCSPQCRASLNLAEEALDFIKANSEDPIFEPWLAWIT